MPIPSKLSASHLQFPPWRPRGRFTRSTGQLGSVRDNFQLMRGRSGWINTPAATLSEERFCAVSSLLTALLLFDHPTLHRLFSLPSLSHLSSGPLHSSFQGPPSKQTTCTQAFVSESVFRRPKLGQTHTRIHAHVHMHVSVKKQHGERLPRVGGTSDKRRYGALGLCPSLYKHTLCSFHSLLTAVPCTHACVLSHFSRVQLFAALQTAAHQAPLSMGFSRQEYWSGSPCLPPSDLPNPGIEPTSSTSTALQTD